MTTMTVETQAIDDLAPVLRVHNQIQHSKSELQKLAKEQSELAQERLHLLKTDHHSPPALRRLAELETEILSIEHQLQRSRDLIVGLENDLPEVREQAQRASEGLAQAEKRFSELRETIMTLTEGLDKEAAKLLETAKHRSELIQELRGTQKQLWHFQEKLHCAPRTRSHENPELGKHTQEFLKLLEG